DAAVAASGAAGIRRGFVVRPSTLGYPVSRPTESDWSGSRTRGRLPADCGPIGPHDRGGAPERRVARLSREAAAVTRPRRKLAPEEVRRALGRWAGGRGPVYLLLARGLEEAVARGDLPEGVPLPAERALAPALAVSRSTVVAAYAALRARG